MPYYAPWLVTLDYVRLHRGLATTEDGDDDLLCGMIADASADFIEGLQRVPMPYVDTKSFGADAVSGLDLKLRDDLLAVTSITDVNGATVDAALYNLRPDNLYPKHTVELKSSGGAYWNLTYREDRIQIAGPWGYVPHYAQNAWRSSVAVVPTGGMTDSSTTLTFASAGAAAVFETGQYVRVGSEIVQMTSLAGAVWTHTRAELGTTAAAHLAAVAMDTFQQLADIRKAVRLMVVYLYLSKDKIGGSTRVYDGGTLVVEDIDPSVEATRKRHMRKPMPMGV